MVRPCAFSEWLKEVIRAPVVMLYASRLDRVVSLLPAAEPDGRALLKLPVTYTVLPTVTWAQATPSICTVGSASAVTVAGVPAGGAESARAGPAATSATTDVVSSSGAVKAAMRRSLPVVGAIARIILCFPSTS